MPIGIAEQKGSRAATSDSYVATRPRIRAVLVSPRETMPGAKLSSSGT